MILLKMGKTKMNRITGGICCVYSIDNIYEGSYECYTELYYNQGIDNRIDNSSYQNQEKLKIVVKNYKKSLENCKLTIFKKHDNNYYALKEYKVIENGVEDENAWVIDDADIILSEIEQIPREEYEKLRLKRINNIEWNKIKTEFSGEIITKDKAFENLCIDLINKIKITEIETFHPKGRRRWRT